MPSVQGEPIHERSEAEGQRQVEEHLVLFMRTAMVCQQMGLRVPALMGHMREALTMGRPEIQGKGTQTCFEFGLLAPALKVRKKTIVTTIGRTPAEVEGLSRNKVGRALLTCDSLGEADVRFASNFSTQEGLPVATPERATSSSVKSKMGNTRPVTHKRKRKKCW